MRWKITVECVGEDGKQCTITLGTIERLAGSTTAETLGINLQESKQIANRLQDTVVKQQLQEHCEQSRKCLTCGRLRPIKDFKVFAVARDQDGRAKQHVQALLRAKGASPGKQGARCL